MDIFLVEDIQSILGVLEDKPETKQKINKLR